MILVTGATGTVGREVVKELTIRGERVRGLTRDPGKAGFLRQHGVEIAAGDLSRPETLDLALKGCDRVFLLGPSDARQTELETNVIEAAKRAGVRQIAKLSVYGADERSPVAYCRFHAQVEQRLAESGIAHTNLRPNYFMQNMFNYANSISQQGAFYAPLGEGRISMVDVRDIAAVAAAVLTERGHEGKTYEVTGPEALSFGEAAQILSRVLGRKVEYVDIQPEQARSSLLGMGVPGWLVEAILAMMSEYKQGRGARVSDIVQKVGKRQPRTFEQFTREFADRLAGVHEEVAVA